MKSSRVTLAVFAFVLAGFMLAGTASGSLFDKRKSRNGSLIADVTAREIGDIVTIIIEEKSSASRDVKTETEKDTKTKALVETLFFPSQSFFKDDKENPTFKWDSVSDFEGSASVTSKGNLEVQLTARVIDKFHNGNLLIEASRTIEIDESKLKIILTGIIRTADIKADNTIESTFIADAKIEYVDEGMGNVHKFGILTRLWNWLNIF